MRILNKTLFSFLLLLMSVHIGAYILLGGMISVDTWPLINMAEITLSNPTLKLTDDSVWDKHNNRWPGIVYYSIVASEITDLGVKNVYKYLIHTSSVVITAIALVIIFRKISDNTLCSIIGAGVTLVAPPILFFSLASIKEVYAWPIAAVLIVNTIVCYDKPSKVGYISSSLLGLSSAISHPLPLFMVVSILALAFLFYRVSLYMGLDDIRISSSPGYPAKIMVPPFSIFLLYNLSFGLRNTNEISIMSKFIDVYPYYLYALMSFYLISVLVSGKRLPFLLLSVSVIVSLFMVFHVNIVPHTAYASRDLTVYIASFLAGISVYAFVKKSNDKGLRTYMLLKYITGATGVLIGSIVAFATVYATPLFTLIHRFINYVYPSFGAAASYSCRNGSRTRILIATIFLFMIFLSFTTVVTLVNEDKGVRYTWRYTRSEIEAFNTIKELGYNASFTGDQKILYYYKFVHSVSLLDPKILIGYNNITYKGVLIAYRDNYIYGFWIDPLDIVEPELFIAITGNSNARVYDNILVGAFWNG